jgi:N-acetylmuramoyl-L-alanine amidase
MCRNSNAFITKENRITYGIENLQEGNIVLRTNTSCPLPPPRIQYLPSQSGLSMMVADFEGLVWPYPARMIRPTNTQNKMLGQIKPNTIEFINLGQFQSAPPIFRVTVAARNSEAIRNLSFQAGVGSLRLSWAQGPKENPLAETPTIPSLLSKTDELAGHHRQAAKENEGETGKFEYFEETQGKEGQALSQSPPRNGDQKTLRLSFSSESLPLAPDRHSKDKSKDAGKELGKEPSDDMTKEANKKPVAQSNTRNTIKSALESSLDSASESGEESRMPINESRLPTNEALGDESPLTLKEMPPLAPPVAIIPPTISFNQNEPTEIVVKAQNKIAFKTFRLREPERFVVDFEDLPGLSQSELPPLSDNQFLKSIRVGAPKAKTTEGRLVCDLASDTTGVETKLSEAGNALSLIFKHESPKESQAIPKGMSIVLDAGHGGSDPGAQRGPMQEKDLTLPIVLFLKQKLERQGIKVALTRSDDTFVSLEDRVRLTNTMSPDLFLSVHINSLDVDRDLHGIETYYQTPQSKLLAECVHESLVNHLDASDRSVRKARFYVINHTPVPAVLAEVGFISCKEEREKLISSDYQKRIARALEHGVMLYLRKQSELAQTGLAERSLWAKKDREANGTGSAKLAKSDSLLERGMR